MYKLGIILIAALWPRLAVAAGLRLKSKGIFSSLTGRLNEKECTCNCCIAAKRRPSEINARIDSKCTAPPQSDERVKNLQCKSTCSLVNDPIFPNTPEAEYNRFCFYH